MLAEHDYDLDRPAENQQQSDSAQLILDIFGPEDKLWTEPNFEPLTAQHCFQCN